MVTHKQGEGVGLEKGLRLNEGLGYESAGSKFKWNLINSTDTVSCGQLCLPRDAGRFHRTLFAGRHTVVTTSEVRSLIDSDDNDTKSGWVKSYKIYHITSYSMVVVGHHLRSKEQSNLSRYCTS